MSVNKTLQLKRQGGFATVEAAKTAIEAAFAAQKFAVGEPIIATLNDGSVVLGICGSSTSGSVFYNASTIDGLIDAIENEIGDLSTLGTDAKTSIVAAINSLKASNVAYVSGSTDTVVSGATNVDQAIKAIDAAIAGIQAGEAEYTIVSGTPSETNVKEVYQLQKTVGGTSTNVGLPIKIYKDSSLYNVYLGHVDDTITSASNPTVVPGTGSEALCFIYLKTDGTYELVAVDVESFLQESEFKDGLQVVNNEVSVKLDATAGSDSAKFLYMKEVSGGNGAIALSGITDAITTAVNTAVQGLDAVESGSTTHVSVKVTEVDGVITGVDVTESDIASASDLSDEVTARKAVTGQNGDTYTANTTANYISGATSMNAADIALDTQVKANADAIAALENAKVSVVKGAGSENFLNITTNAEETVYTVTVSGITNAINTAVSGAVETLDAAEVGGTGKYLTTISEANGIITATAADLNAAAVAATPITAGNDTVAVTGTTVDAQIASLAETAKDIQDAAYSGVTSANAAINAGAVTNNGQVLTFQLDTTTASHNATSDLVSISEYGLLVSDTYDCGTWS